MKKYLDEEGLKVLAENIGAGGGSGSGSSGGKFEPKLLWEGTNWITGTINIPGVSEYKALYFEMSTNFAQGFGVIMTKIESNSLFAADITTQPIRGQTNMNLERHVVICRYDADSLTASTNLLRTYRITSSLAISFVSGGYGCQRVWGLF